MWAHVLPARQAGGGSSNAQDGVPSDSPGAASNDERPTRRQAELGCLQSLKTIPGGLLSWQRSSVGEREREKGGGFVDFTERSAAPNLEQLREPLRKQNPHLVLAWKGGEKYGKDPDERGGGICTERNSCFEVPA